MIWLAQRLEYSHLTEFSIERIQPIWVADKFFDSVEWNAKQTFGAYAGAILGGSFGILCSYPIGLAGGLGWAGQFISTIVLGILVGLIFKIVLVQDEVLISESISWSLNILKELKLLIRVVMPILIGYCTIGLYEGISHDLLEKLLDLLMKVVPVNLFVIVAFGFSNSDIEEEVVANEGIRRTFFAALTKAILVGLPAGLIAGKFINTDLGIVFRILFGLNCGLIVGTWFGLVYGFNSCLNHLVLRKLMCREEYAPWNYVQFLEYCTERLLLQRVGGRYRFIHKQLQEHLAAMPLD